MTEHKTKLRYQTAESILPPDLYEAVRSRLPPKALIYIRPIGQEMNKGEAMLGANLVRRIRQALCLRRRGMNLYLGSEVSAGRPPNRLRGPVSLLADEGWPPRTIQDALGLSRSVVSKLKGRRPSATQPREIPELFSDELLQRVGVPTREDIIETLGVMLQFRRHTPTWTPDTDVETLKRVIFEDKVPGEAAVEALMARVTFAAQARRRLRLAGFRPPTTAAGLEPASE